MKYLSPSLFGFFLLFYCKVSLRATFHNHSQSTGNTIKVLITRQISYKLQQNQCINSCIPSLLWFRNLIVSGYQGIIDPRDLKINVLDRRSDGQQSDPKSVPFLPLEIQNPKNIIYIL